jgi:hypothetical protein
VPREADWAWSCASEGQEYQSALSELDEEAADEPAALEIDDDSDDDQTPVASMVRKPESSTAGVVPGDLLTPQACEHLVSSSLTLPATASDNTHDRQRPSSQAAPSLRRRSIPQLEQPHRPLTAL